MGGMFSSPYTHAQIEQERQRTLSQSLEERRRSYRDYVTIDDIKTWKKYWHDDIKPRDRVSTSPFRVSEQINSKVSLWQGDITRLELNAIVNSAAKYNAGKVNLAIMAKAGDYYKAECLMRGLGPPGEAMVTAGYHLPAQHVINTLAPRNRESHILENCYSNSLDAAKQNGVRSIAVPCIATQMKMRFRRIDAAKIALYTVRSWLERHHDAVDRVVFCVYGDVDRRTYRKYMQEYFPVEYEKPQSTSPPPTDELDQCDFYDSDESEVIQGAAGGTSAGGTTAEMPSGCSTTVTALFNNYHAIMATLDETLEAWRSRTVKASFPQTIQLNRMEPIGTFKQLFKMYSPSSNIIDLLASPKIEYEGEPGIDLGALTQEYFIQTLDTLTTTVYQGSHTFDGAPDHKLPAASHVQRELGIFHVIGRALAHSVLHRGLGLVGLSPALVYLLSHDVRHDKVDESAIEIGIEDVPDTELREFLTVGLVGQVDRANEFTTKQKHDLIKIMERYNLGYMKINNSTINYIKQGLLLYEVVFRRWPVIEALREGMNSVRDESVEGSPGLYTFLCRNPTEENIREVFPSNRDLEVEPEVLLSKVKFEARDGRIVKFFKTLLDDIHKGVLAPHTLTTVLQFWTADPLLPLGQTLTVDIAGDQTLPLAQSCFARLTLPGAHDQYESFREAFRVALEHGAQGFGLE